MADKEKDASRQPTHRAFAVIRREGQDDFWLNLGLAFPHKDRKGFNIMLQALPLDGKLVCREVTEEADPEVDQPPARGKPERRAVSGR